MCLPLVRLYLGKVVFLVFSIIFFVPTCYLLYKTKNNNMLCSELEVKGLSCPFSVGTASFCFYVLSFFYCAVIALYFFPCNNFITMLIPELPWSEYDKSDTFRYPRGCEIVKIIVSLLSMAVVFTTWGFFLYFLITLLLRILIMSSSTRNILDDFSFVIFPLFLVVYDYITNVTKEFKVISENIFDLVRNDDELKCSSINSKKKLNEAILLSGEDQTIEGSLTYVGKELRLNINCPFIFQRRDGRMYTSKRLVTQIYNDSSEFLPFELSAYLKAFLVSLVPCALYAIVFMVFVTYTSIISYSTHVAGYTATALTGLKWLHSKVGSLIQEILISNKSVKQSVKERLKQERLNFHESWKVSAIHFKGDAAPIEIPQQVDSVAPTET
ncbi:hypothetical protein BgiBS90_027210 [Biomphalaria glabrata]|nr:hypothetical protein BgiBS90_027210 [Biomphalaria glabrata]